MAEKVGVVSEDEGVVIPIRKQASMPMPVEQAPQQDAPDSDKTKNDETEEKTVATPSSMGRGVTIAAPKHEDEPEKQTEPTEPAPAAEAQSEEKSKPEKQTERDPLEVAAELIATKKYFLPIKETYSSSFFRLSSKQKHAKEKVTAKKKLEKHEPVPSPKVKKRASKSEQLFGGVVLILLVLGGAYLALDAGVIDVGWKPPISILRK